MAEIQAHADTHHHPALGHHWETMEQQHEGNILGMWLFLITEVMLFGGLFTSYIIFRMLYPDVFQESSHFQNVPIGTFNTVILITSSLTMALAVRSAQLANRRALVIFLLLTTVLGLAFVGFKGYEYYQHWHEGLVPGMLFTNPELDPRAQIYFFLYFTMTGLHAIHMLIGIGIVIVLAVQAMRGRYLGPFYAPVELMGLYWHFVDVVWVFLFPLLYLLGRQ